MSDSQANAARAIALGGPALAQVEALGPIDWPLWARTAEALRGLTGARDGPRFGACTICICQSCSSRWPGSDWRPPGPSSSASKPRKAAARRRS